MTRHTPQHGWTCFHCGETFTRESEAADHFGHSQLQEAACIVRVQHGGERGLLAALRKSECELVDALNAIHDETLTAYQQMRAQQGRHSEALRIAEEAGYERGLADMRKELSAAIDNRAFNRDGSGVNPPPDPSRVPSPPPPPPPPLKYRPGDKL